MEGGASSGDILIGTGVGLGVDGRGGSGGGGSGKMDVAVASESAALTGLGFALRRDVRAGEAVFLDVQTGAVSSRLCAPSVLHKPVEEDGEVDGGEKTGEEELRVRFKPCLFEYVYMARPDSILDGVPVSCVF